MEVEEGVAVGDSLLLIVHGSAYSILSHYTLPSSLSSALLRLHQLVYLGVAGRTDTKEDRKQHFHKNANNNQEQKVSSLTVSALLNLPRIECAEEEDDQTNNALGIPPLHLSCSAVTGWHSGADV